MNGNKPILVVHPQVGAVGGSEFSLAVLLELLTNDLNLKTVLLTHEMFPVSEFNRVWRTNINYENLEVISLKFPRKFASTFSYLKCARLSSYVKKNLSKFSLVISAYNPLVDIEETISLIGDVTFVQYESSKVRRFVYKLINLFFGLKGEISENNIIVSNSEFSRRVIKEHLGIESCVIYPPVYVVSDPEKIPWYERENGFVYIGRISREKRVLEVIDVVKALRGKGYDLHLHIVGTGYDRKYLESVKLSCSAPWCRMDGAKYGYDKEEILLSHKFGINLCDKETFGISVAEQVALGEVVFVADSGGQVEIVEDEFLRVKDKEDLLNKFEILINNEVKMQEVRKKLKDRVQRFHKDFFKEEMKRLLERFLKWKD